MLKPIRTMTSVAVIAMMTSHVANAGGFSLYTESSAAAIGNFAAGVAAEGADASIGWYNPAGLVLIKEQQVLLGGVGVFPSTKLTGTTTNTTINPLGPPNFPFSQSFNGLQSAKEALVPSLHYALPLGERATFGLSIVAPFGLSTVYPSTSPLRYAATLSQFETYNVSPEIGGKLTEHFSIGAGLDLQYATVKFNSMTGAPGVVHEFGPEFPPTITDSQSYNTGNSFGVGFHAGAMLMLNENHSRIGFNYQSAMRHQFSGQSLLTGNLADPTFEILDPVDTGNPNASYKTDMLLSNNISLPNVITLSGYQDVNEKLALLGSVVYSGWSLFKTISLNNVAAGIPVPFEGTDLTLLKATTIENYRDAWRFALGANYHVTDSWMMRIGGGYDQTPTVNAYRDVRLPDSDRWALSIGAHYQALPCLGFDVGYTYLFAVSDAKINSTLMAGPSIVTVDAISKNHAQLFGLQGVWMIDQAKAVVTK